MQGSKESVDGGFRVERWASLATPSMPRWALQNVRLSSFAMQGVNRPSFELTPRSWTNFKGLHEEVQNGVQVGSGPKLFGWRRRREAFGSGDGRFPRRRYALWVSHYRLDRIDGLRPKRSTYSAQFKLQVLSHQDREQLSSRQVAAI
ncbi:MAG: hypothetical protein EON49_08270 [Acidovorax sp.]|nr:MAG: hypothetical protein EON49_08270 [Acidovorax sp.]